MAGTYQFGSSTRFFLFVLFIFFILIIRKRQSKRPETMNSYIRADESYIVFLGIN